MCGIVGKLDLDGNQPVQRELLRRMMDQIVHRGPDGEGDYFSGPIGLGHRRLSIIGLESGAPADEQRRRHRVGGLQR